MLRLVEAILQPVLPGRFMNDLAAGMGIFYGIISPAIPPIIAVGALCALGWIILGTRR